MNFKDILFYLMIIVVIGLGLYLVMFTRGEGFKCISSPLKYAASSLSDNPTCGCSSPGVETIHFNSTLIWSGERINPQYISMQLFANSSN